MLSFIIVSIAVIITCLSIYLIFKLKYFVTSLKDIGSIVEEDEFVVFSGVIADSTVTNADLEDSTVLKETKIEALRSTMSDSQENNKKEQRDVFTERLQKEFIVSDDSGNIHIDPTNSTIHLTEKQNRRTINVEAKQRSKYHLQLLEKVHRQQENSPLYEITETRIDIGDDIYIVGYPILQSESITLNTNNSPYIISDTPFTVSALSLYYLSYLTNKFMFP